MTIEEMKKAIREFSLGLGADAVGFAIAEDYKAKFIENQFNAEAAFVLISYPIDSKEGPVGDISLRHAARRCCGARRVR